MTVYSIPRSERLARHSCRIELTVTSFPAFASVAGMEGTRPPLLTARFAAIWAVSFAAAAASFQLFPAVPFRILELGGTQAASGLFLGALTIASALSAPWTGGLADLLGRRRVLVGAGLVLALLGLLYAVVPRWEVLAWLAVPHGVAWSSLLTASLAYSSDLVPLERRAEGMAYFGLASTLAIALAPALGFALARRGWSWLCASLVLLYLAVALLALRLPESGRGRGFSLAGLLGPGAVEWGSLRLGVSLLLVSLGYGGVTSFVAQLSAARGIEPRGLFFSVFAGTILLARPLLGSSIDRFGARRAVPICCAFVVLGLGLLAGAQSRGGLAAAAVAFGGGFSTLYPAFSAFVLERVDAARRGAAFGAMLAAFDIGIGGGSILFGPLVARFGYTAAFALAAAAAAVAGPYFLLVSYDRTRASTAAKTDSRFGLEK